MLYFNLTVVNIQNFLRFYDVKKYFFKSLFTADKIYFNLWKTNNICVINDTYFKIRKFQITLM